MHLPFNPAQLVPLVCLADVVLRRTSRFRVEDPDEVDVTIAKANEVNDRPVVVEFRCISSEKVYPMVPAGGSNDDILVDPSQRGA